MPGWHEWPTPSEEAYDLLERRLARSVEALADAADPPAPWAGGTPVIPALLFESSAGGGDSMGRDPGELGRLLAWRRGARGYVSTRPISTRPGYALDTADGLDRLHEELAAAGCLDLVGLVHLNDSKTPLASRSDRHENLWDGQYGRTGLRRVMRSAHLRTSPFIMEVPGADGHGTDRRNIRRARILRREAAGLTQIRVGA